MDEIELRTEARGHVVFLRGQVTVENAPLLRLVVLEAVRADRTLAVDASSLTRLDAAAIQVLVAGAREATRAVRRGPPASQAWLAAFSRYGIVDAFVHEHTG